jgi:hypothetical protein
VRSLRFITVPLAGLATMAMLSGCGDTATPTGIDTGLDTTPPPAPTNLVQAYDGAGRPVLAWDASPAADVVSYAVYVYSPDPSRDNAYVLVDDSNPADSRFELPRVSENTTVIYRVKAVDGAGNRSAYSAATEIPLGAQGDGGGPVDPIEIR